MLRLMTQAGFLTDLSGTIKSARRELESSFTSVSENTLAAKAAQYRAPALRRSLGSFMIAGYIKF